MSRLIFSGLLDTFRNWRRNKVMAASFSTMIVGVFGWFQLFSSDVDIASLNKHYSQPSVIYDKNGNVASKLSSNKFEGVTIKQIPKSMKDAVVAIEDHRFYKHGGVDFIGILRAFYKDVIAGAVVEGGSTITQQLAKNALLTSKKTFSRKIEEIYLAWKIEKKYSKDEILQMYLNQIYFGDGAWGLKSAASKYFGKDVQKLTVSESAMLAGLIKAPSALNPYDHLKKATARRNVVLNEMKKQGFITKNVYLAASIEKIDLKNKQGDPFRGKYPYYVDQILDEAINQYGLSQDKLLSGGYQIYTEMDQKMQSGMESTFQDDALFPKGNGRMVQSGAVLSDPQTGGIRALVGGRGNHVFRGYNRASQLKAQPGSSFKPIAVYTPALELGWKITDMLKDEPLKFGNYQPRNYNSQYAGEVPMYEAVKQSKNVPAVWLLNEIGLNYGMDSIKRFGIQLEKGDRSLSVALGGLERGVSPLTMGEAFSVFPNGGERIKSHVIRKIVDAEGKIVAHWKENKIKVTTKEVTAHMNTMLLGVVEDGTGKGAQVPGYEIAGKTGSTQVPISGNNGVKDQWFVGYTPNLVGAVWVGYDKTDTQHYLTTTSSEGAALVFRSFMGEALKNSAPQHFDVQHIGDRIGQKNEEKTQSNEQTSKANNVQQTRASNQSPPNHRGKKHKGHGHGHGHGHGGGGKGD